MPTSRKAGATLANRDKSTLQGCIGLEGHQTHLGPQIVPPAPYRQQILNAFLCRFVPVSQLQSAGQKSWLVMVSELPTPTQALQTSLLAMCTARLGRQNNDADLVKESLRLYTKGLCELQKALWDPKLMYKDETLGACQSLAMYEVMECPDENKGAYTRHQDGCAKLVELRGANAHRSGLGHQLFLSFRRQMIIQTLDRHRPIYLTSPDWTSKPWIAQPKSPSDRLLDLVALAPSILQAADALPSLPPEQNLHEMLRLIHSCLEIDAELARFYTDLEASTLGPLYWPELSKERLPIDKPTLGVVFPVAFHFPNIRMADTLMMYWATLVMLWSGLHRLYAGISEVASLDPGNDALASLTSRLPPLDHRKDFPSTAWCVCQSVEYCLQPEMLGVGPATVPVPLQIVIDTMQEYPGYEREMGWAREVIKRIAEGGFRILKY